MTPSFERALKRYMRERGIKTKSEAVRAAVREALENARSSSKANVRQLVGAGKGLRQTPRSQWLIEDDLWGPNGH